MNEMSIEFQNKFVEIVDKNALHKTLSKKKWRKHGSINIFFSLLE